MSSTDLSVLSADQASSSGNETAAEFTPNSAFFGSNSVLSLLAAFDPSFADFVADAAAALPEAAGQVTVTDGLFDANLALADGTTLTGSFDAPATLRDYADLAAVSDGSVTLSGGILEAAIATDGQTASLPAFDLSAAVSNLVLDSINAIDATVPFSNGAFALDLATALGPVSGTIDVAGGDLNLDLATPFGQLVAAMDFSDDAVIPFTAPVAGLGNIDGAVDFNSGSIVADVGPFGNLSVPISAVSGAFTLADGVGHLDATLPIGSGLNLPVTADLDVGPLASEYAAGFVQDLDGAGTLTDGVLDATLASPIGVFDTTFDVAAFANQGADFFAGIDGTIDVGGGIATASLTTPLGDINGSVDLAAAAPALETPIAELG
ncbi:hypothetical protein [Nodosilinea nodulosa]|uniref:hypothetical protein n=1 Tax=Nodosilinea nodulosa TaxID=416001 RepID=UPI000310883F|nr:hypothetical protein [Nodosilinea nodulosa]